LPREIESWTLNSIEGGLGAPSQIRVSHRPGQGRNESRRNIRGKKPKIDNLQLAAVTTDESLGKGVRADVKQIGRGFKKRGETAVSQRPGQNYAVV